MADFSKFLICFLAFFLSTASTCQVPDMSGVQASDEKYDFVPGTAIPIGNGTWVYDEVILEEDIGDGRYWDPEYGKHYPRIGQERGLFAGEIIAYNSGATIGRKLHQVYSYATTPETSCKKSKSATGKLVNCAANDREAWENERQITISTRPDTVMESPLTYLQMLEEFRHAMKVKPLVVPVVDGRLDQGAHGFETYLDAMNEFNKPQAEYLAEITAALFCAYDRVASVQFDIEPFDFSQPGQKYFYEKLAYYFSGAGDPLTGHDGGEVNCKTEKYPFGRSWSAFTFPDRVSADYARAMNKYGNGFVIISAYDMENPKGATAGIHTDVETYKSMVRDVVLETMKAAEKYNIYYKIGIPATGTAHEFTAILGKDPKGIMEDDQDITDGRLKRVFPDTTLSYTRAAVEVLNSAFIEVDGNKRYLLDDPKFIGVDVWGWSSHIRSPRHETKGHTEFKPSYPPREVLTFLQSSLPVSRYYYPGQDKHPTEVSTVPQDFQPASDKLPLVELELKNAHEKSFAANEQIVVAAKVRSTVLVEKVEFYEGEKWVGEDSHLPFRHILTGAEPGNYAITAKVVEMGGGSARSDIVNVAVREGFNLASFNVLPYGKFTPNYVTGDDRESGGFSSSSLAYEDGVLHWHVKLAESGGKATLENSYAYVRGFYQGVAAPLEQVKVDLSGYSSLKVRARADGDFSGRSIVVALGNGKSGSHNKTVEREIQLSDEWQEMIVPLKPIPLESMKHLALICRGDGQSGAKLEGNIYIDYVDLLP